jgi:hypothetical protein
VNGAFHAQSNHAASRHSATNMDSYGTLPASLQRRTSGETATSDANLLLGLGSAYVPPGAAASNTVSRAMDNPHRHRTQTDNQQAFQTPHNPNHLASAAAGQQSGHQLDVPFSPYTGHMHGFGDMMIESQDVDMSLLGLDMGLQWFDAFQPTADMSGYFADSGGDATQSGAAM